MPVAVASPLYVTSFPSIVTISPSFKLAIFSAIDSFKSIVILETMVWNGAKGSICLLKAIYGILLKKSKAV